MSNQESDPLESLSDEERRELAELAKARADGKVSRREALGLFAGAAGAGLGGASLLSNSDEGQAAAQSQSNNEPNLGGPTDRWDAWLAGVDANSVTATSVDADTLTANTSVTTDSLTANSSIDADTVTANTSVDTGSLTATSVDTDTLETDQATVGPTTAPTTSIQWDRPQVLKSDTTVQVPQDEPTIQDALRKVPIRFFADYTIAIDKSQDPYNEDIVIPPIQSVGIGTENVGKLFIEDQGSVTDGSNGIEVDSITMIGGTSIVTVVHLQPTGLVPYINENAAWAALRGAELLITDSAVGGTDRGTAPSPTSAILCFGSNIKLQNNFDFGTDLVQRGIYMKRGNQVRIDQTNTITGSVKDEAVFVQAGQISHDGRLPDAPTDVQTFSNSTSGIRLQMTDRNGSENDHVLVDSNSNKRFFNADGTEFLQPNQGLNQTLFQTYEPRVNSGNGDGIVVTTPDGSDNYRIRVDNSGNVVTDGPL